MISDAHGIWLLGLIFSTNSLSKILVALMPYSCFFPYSLKRKSALEEIIEVHLFELLIVFMQLLSRIHLLSHGLVG